MTIRSGRQRRAPRPGVEVPRGALGRPSETVTASLGVAGTFAEIEQVLRTGPEQLVALAYLAPNTTDGSLFDAVLTTRGWRRWLRMPASIEFRTTPRPAQAIIHLTWRARWHPELFPVMEADLGLRPVSGERTELVFAGEYLPPAGLLGLVVDRMVGGRVAVSTAEAFLEDLGAAIEASVGRRAGEAARSEPPS